MSNRTTPQVQADQFALYAGRDVIPLHHPFDMNGEKPIGKAPIENGWVTLPKKPAEKVIARCVAEGRNMGHRPGVGDLFVDVDARSGGLESWDRFIEDAGIIGELYPRTDTGSDGFHYHGSKPPGFRIRKKHPDYPGLEFLSFGAQIVCAGSVHPLTRQHYRAAEGHPAMSAELPPWPPKMLDIIARPERVAASGDVGGEFTPEQLEAALANLDPTDFRDHDEWLQLMFACHSATKGEGGEIFAAWSTSDPEYADATNEILHRWDSCDPNRSDGYTFRTVNMILRQHGASDAQVGGQDAAADFEGQPIDQDTKTPGATKLKKDTYTLKRATARKPLFDWDSEADVDTVKAVLVQGWKVDKECTTLPELIALCHRMGLHPKTAYENIRAVWPALFGDKEAAATKNLLRQIIVYYCDALHGPGEQATGNGGPQAEEQSDGTWYPRYDNTRLAPLKDWNFIIGSYQFIHDDGAQFMSDKQFEMKFGKLFPQTSIMTNIKRGKSPMKKWTAQVFVPLKPPIFRYEQSPVMTYQGKAVFNLWRPGPLLPVAGDHQWFLDHVAKLFPNTQYYRDLFIDYLAQLVQHPDVKIMYALLLQSVEGAGKGAMAYLLRRILGERNTIEPSNDEVTGEWTDWQEHAQLAIVHELMAIGKLEVLNRLKAVISEDKLRLAKKYAHRCYLPNYLNFFCMTNHKDSLPLTLRDRRWLVLFSPFLPAENDPYYKGLWANLHDDTKVAAVYHYLMHRPITVIDPKAHAPMTEAKREMQDRARSDAAVDLEITVARTSGTLRLPGGAGRGPDRRIA